jgi:two-component system LytT family response regulator
LFEKRKIASVSSEKIEKLLSTLSTGSSNIEKIALPTFTGFQLEKISSILYCEADHNYTKVHLEGGENLLVSKPLNVIQELLPNEIFHRIHKSHLVNLNFIKLFSRTDGHHVILDNGIRLDVASRRKDDFIKVLTKRQTNEH